MKAINRFAIAVMAREPCLAWARGLSDADVDVSPQTFASVYLVEVSDEFNPNRLIRSHYERIFEEQLNSWHRDEAVWPEPRTEAMFREWFETRVVDMVWDSGRGPIEAES